MAHLRLANAVDTTEALFDPIGVPWQVVVHHQVSSLQVDTLTRSVGSHQDRDILVLGERLLDLATLLTPKAAMDRNHSVGLAGQASQPADTVVQRVAMVREDD